MKATEVTAGLAESNGSLLPVYGMIHFTSPAGWLPVHWDQLRAQRSVTSMGKLYFYLLAPKPYVPHQLAYKRYIFGMSTSPQNDSCCPKLCCWSCMLVTSTSPEILLPRAVFRGCKAQCRNLEISHRCMLQDPIHVLSVVSNTVSAQDMCLKGQTVLVTEKKQNVSAAFGRTAAAISPIFCASVHCGPT